MAGAKVSIADLRPTQLTLGLAEVEERAAKIAAMSPTDREAYLHRKPIPYVWVPESRSTSSTTTILRGRCGR